MDQFDSLLHVAEELLGPHGCPWDQKQTFLSLQPYVLEEAHEVIEAVDADDDRKIIEELGDFRHGENGETPAFAQFRSLP